MKTLLVVIMFLTSANTPEPIRIGHAEWAVTYEACTRSFGVVEEILAEQSVVILNEMSCLVFGESATDEEAIKMVKNIFGISIPEIDHSALENLESK